MSSVEQRDAAKETYGSSEVCELAGITYRQLDVWCRKGLVNGGTPGYGHSRKFTNADLVAIQRLARRKNQLVAELNDLGFRVVGQSADRRSADV